MNPFEYQRPTRTRDALQELTRRPDAKLLAGGTNLVDLMKDSVETPALLVDISRLPLQRIEPLPDGGLRLGALAKNAETANHPLVLPADVFLSRAGVDD